MNSITDYISIFPHRQPAWFKLLADNRNVEVNILATRFLKGELTQSRCPHFKVNP
jgi:hypothetical protein